MTAPWSGELHPGPSAACPRLHSPTGRTLVLRKGRPLSKRGPGSSGGRAVTAGSGGRMVLGGAGEGGAARQREAGRGCSGVPLPQGPRQPPRGWRLRLMTPGEQGGAAAGHGPPTPAAPAPAPDPVSALRCFAVPGTGGPFCHDGAGGTRQPRATLGPRGLQDMPGTALPGPGPWMDSRKPGPADCPGGTDVASAPGGPASRPSSGRGLSGSHQAPRREGPVAIRSPVPGPRQPQASVGLPHRGQPQT